MSRVLHTQPHIHAHRGRTCRNRSGPKTDRSPCGTARVCVRCSYKFTLRRAPLYAPDRRARAHRRGQAGGGDVTPQPAVRVFIFHFRGGSFQSSVSDRCPETRTPRPDPGRAKPAFNPALGGHTSASPPIGWIRRGSCYICVTFQSRRRVVTNTGRLRSPSKFKTVGLRDSSTLRVHQSAQLRSVHRRSCMIKALMSTDGGQPFRTLHRCLIGF